MAEIRQSRTMPGGTFHTLGQLRFEPAQTIRILIWMRLSAVTGQAITVLLVHFGMGLELPLQPLMGTIVLLAAWNLVAWFRLRTARKIGNMEVFGNLMVDAVALTVLLALTGGPSNPFASLYLVPVAMAAVAMPLSLALMVTTLCVILYASLLATFMPMEAPHSVLGGDFDLHLIGLWVNFIISAALIAVFVRFMASVLRRQDLRLADAREDTLRNEQIVALGTQAAGAAHQLGTPLSTLTMVIDEIRSARQDDAELLEELDLARSQVDICKRTLEELVATGVRSKGAAARPVSLRRFMERVLDTWKLVHPEIRPTIQYADEMTDVVVREDPTLMHALLNLLNNAADASVDNQRRGVEVRVAGDGEKLWMTIDDEGPGFDPDRLPHAGRVIQSSTKPSGMGIGLVLANATVDRFGGSVKLLEAPTGGVRTEIELPLRDLVLTSDDESKQ